MAGGSPLCLAGRWSVDWFWQRDWQNVAWLLVGGWVGFFYCKIHTKKLTGFFWAVDWLHGWRLSSLLSYSVVGWLVLAKRDWQNVGCLLIDGWLGVFFYCKIETKTTFFLAVDWLHGLRLPSLLSWSVVGWLVLAKRLTECWLAVDWWVDRFFTAKLRLKLFLAVDWLHGLRLPALLSWSLVGWLVLAKRLTECWLTVDWWVAECFFTAKFTLKNWRVFLSSWLTAWLAAPLFV